MHCRWLFTFALYIYRISGDADYRLATCRKSFSYDVIYATESTCYTVHSSEKSWRDAKKSCEQLGGNLTVLHNHHLKVEIFVNLNVRGLGLKTWWIGAKERGYGSYFWLDGQELRLREFPMMTSGLHGLRELLGAEKNCVALMVDLWLFTCMKMWGYICEHDNTADGLNQDSTALPTLETRVPSPPPDQDVMTEEVDTVTPSRHDQNTADGLNQVSTALPTLETRAPSPPPDQDVITEEVDTVTTSSHDTSREKPEVPIQYLFRGIKSVGGYYNPRLIAYPDYTATVPGIQDCLRLCYAQANCRLVNFKRPAHCGMYSDPVGAQKLGAEPVTGWSVWLNLYNVE